MIKKTCPICGNEFITKSEKSKYCSRSCSISNNNINRAKREKIKISCLTCGKEIETYLKTKKYCSFECKNPNANKVYEKKCIICGSIFYHKDKRKKCCSDICTQKSFSLGGPKKKKNNKTCIVCKNEFYPKKNTSKYCSKECYNTDHSIKYIEKKCPICSSIFKVSDNNIGNSRIFCGQSCSAIHNNNERLKNGYYLNPKNIKNNEKLENGANIRILKL